MSRALPELLDSLHSEVAKALLKKVQSGEATAADLNAAAKFLKDNGIEAVPVAGSPLAALAAASVPFPSQLDDDNHTYQ
jgi:predicted nucleic acid-binding protein